MKFIRLDADHFAYLVDQYIGPQQAREIMEQFAEAWPGKRLLVLRADEFIDMTGQYEIVPIGALSEDAVGV